MKKFCIALGAVLLSYMVLFGNYNKAAAEENTMKYEYDEDGIVDGSLELKVPASAGKNYEVTIKFTGVSQENATISIGYDNVTDDQIVPNVVNSSDRSGLLNETVKEGIESSRTFSVAAINDEIVFSAEGKGKILSIELKETGEPADDGKITIFTIGDSLVQTYAEKYAPQTGWGQMLQMYFDDSKVVCKNYAIGGRSTGNFLRQGRLNEVLVNISEGDYVLIQFGHNDATAGNADRYVSVEDYKKNLKDIYIKAIEQRGGIPVLVTLANRNDYNASTGVFNVSFPNYVEAMRQVADETGTLLIDLNAKTVEAFTQLNKELGIGATEALIYNHAIAGAYGGEYIEGVADNTHLQAYGAKLVAGMVAEGLCELELEPLKKNYISHTVTEAPQAPTGIETKKYYGFVSRIKWKESEGADYYKVYVADAKDGAATGEFKFAGYTTVCDFAYDDATLKHDYAYKVVAVNAAGESPESEEYVFESGKEDETKKKADLFATEEEPESNNTGLIIGIIAAVAVVIAVVAVIIVIKKKKK